MRLKDPVNITLGIAVEILYAFGIISAAFLVCLLIAWQI